MSTKKSQIAIIGSGSWATSLAKIFTDAKNHVHWYIRDQEEAKAVRQKGRNPSYLSSIKFPQKSISVSSDINCVISACNWIVLAIPSAFLDTTLKQIDVPFEKKWIISGVKGIIPESKCIVGDILTCIMICPWNNF